MERELPGASTPTSAAMPAHDQMLSQFRLTSQYMFASAAAACSCTATGPPVAKSPTSAATPACAWTQSQILAVAEGCRSNSSALLRSSNSLTLFLLSATLGQVHYVAQRGHPGLASCSAQRCPNIPGAVLVTAQSAVLLNPRSSPQRYLQPAGAHHTAGRERVDQRRKAGTFCRLLAAVVSVPRP